MFAQLDFPKCLNFVTGTVPPKIGIGHTWRRRQ
jgi:hypothetical protein